MSPHFIQKLLAPTNVFNGLPSIEYICGHNTIHVVLELLHQQLHPGSHQFQTLDGDDGLRDDDGWRTCENK